MGEFEFDEPKGKGSNRTGTVTQCRTCGGDRFVTVRLRRPDQTSWMDDHERVASSRSYHEEVAPCPDCNHTEIEFYRHNRTRFVVMDPALVRQSIVM